MFDLLRQHKKSHHLFSLLGLRAWCRCASQTNVKVKASQGKLQYLQGKQWACWQGKEQGCLKVTWATRHNHSSITWQLYIYYRTRQYNINIQHTFPHQPWFIESQPHNRDQTFLPHYPIWLMCHFLPLKNGVLCKSKTNHTYTNTGSWTHTDLNAQAFAYEGQLRAYI